MTHTTSCPTYSKVWAKSDCAQKLLDHNHAYTVGTEEAPEFVRITDYFKHEPARGLTWSGPRGARTNNATPCACGKPDAWKCWHAVLQGEVLGGDRVARTGRGYTVFPECPVVNYTILSAVAKVVPLRQDPETGLPCEEARDLASHLAMRGVRTNADGSFSTYFLMQEAVAYFRKTKTPGSISNETANNRRPTKDTNHE